MAVEILKVDTGVSAGLALAGNDFSHTITGGAEKASGTARSSALEKLAGELETDAAKSSDAAKVRTLEGAVKQAGRHHDLSEAGTGWPRPRPPRSRHGGRSGPRAPRDPAGWPRTRWARAHARPE